MAVPGARTIFEALLLTVQASPVDGEIQISPVEAQALMRELSGQAMTATHDVRRQSARAVVNELSRTGRAKFLGRALVLASKRT